MGHASRGLVEGLTQAWQDHRWTDVTLVGGDGVEIRAHRIVLACVSPMLAQAFESDLATLVNDDSLILCPDVSSSQLEALLEPMYLGGHHPVILDDTIGAVLGIEPPFFTLKSPQPTTMWTHANQEDHEPMESPILPETPEDPVSLRLSARYRFAGSTAVCRACEKTYQYRGTKSDGILSRHIKRHHPEIYDEPEEGNHRSESERENNDDVIEKTESDAEFDFVRSCFDITGSKASCKLCSRRPISIAGGLKALRQHVTSKHPHLLTESGPIQFLVLSDQSIQCQGCWKKLDVLEDRDQVLRVHQKECAPRSQEPGKENVSDPSLILLRSYFLPSTGSESSLTCNVCLKEFEVTEKNYQKLERHLCCAHTDLYEEYVRKRDELASIEKEAAAKIFSKISGFFESDSESDRVQSCKECGQVVKLKSDDDTRSLAIHVKQKHLDLLTEWLTESAFSPDEFDKLINQRGKQSRKKLAVDDDPLNRTCTQCSKVFSRTINLQLHMAAVHSGNRPFKCDTCDATFSRKETYMRHGHVNNRPFLCSVCGNTYARRHIRDIHERAHFGDKRYGCSFCNKRFVTNQKKTNHERTHTGEKPFGCDICGKRFAQKHQLTTHSRIHTGERPFKCENCHRMFRHLTTRARHNCVGFLDNLQQFVLQGQKDTDTVQTIEIFPGEGEDESDQVIVRTDGLQSI